MPDSVKVLIGEVESVDISEEFAHEKLSPVLAMYRAKDFNDAVDKAERLIADGGFGHTSSVYINQLTEKAKLDMFFERMKTCRILVNTPSYSLLPRRYRRPVQLQTQTVADVGLRFLGR